MESSGRLAFTGSLFALPLTVLGAALTLAGWAMQKLAGRDQKLT
jgi:hypothetical protein